MWAPNKSATLAAERGARRDCAEKSMGHRMDRKGRSAFEDVFIRTLHHSRIDVPSYHEGANATRRRQGAPRRRAAAIQSPPRAPGAGARWRTRPEAPAA